MLPEAHLPETTTDDQELWAYDTCIWFQNLVHDGPRYRLERFYKDERADGAAVDGLGTRHHQVRFLPPLDATARTLVYELRCPDMLATHLPQKDADQGQVFHDLGAALAGFHRSAPLPGRGSTTLARFTDYLAEGRGTPAGHALAGIGRERLELVRQWLRELEEQKQVLCHGAFTLGTVFEGAGHRLDVAVGPEVTTGPPELDLGWMLGDLMELEHMAMTLGLPTEGYGVWGQALVAGYAQESGHEADTALLTTVAALRVVLHHCDFAASHPMANPSSENTRFLCWLVDRAAWVRGQDVPSVPPAAREQTAATPSPTVTQSESEVPTHV